MHTGADLGSGVSAPQPPPPQTPPLPQVTDFRHPFRLARHPLRADSAPAWLVAIGPWVSAHVVVVLALLAVQRRDGLHQTGEVPGALGLWVWDGGWYRWIADVGYAGVPPDGVRFFPLLPMIGRAFAWLPGGTSTALILASLAASFGYLHQLVLLVREELGSDVIATRTAWFAALLPGASVFVLPYTEPVALTLAVAFFRAVRNRDWALAVVLGVLSGLVRPTGVLLALPALLLVLNGRADLRALAGKAAAVVSPLVGTGLYLSWAWWARGDFWAPYSVQFKGNLRGGVATSPLEHLFVTEPGGLDWQFQLALVGAALLLLPVVVFRLPLAYSAWSALMFAAGITSNLGHSVPRYLAGIFPFAIALGILSAGRARMTLALAACAVPFAVIAFLGFTTYYVP